MARAGEKVNFISYLDLIKWTICLSQQLSHALAIRNELYKQSGSSGQVHYPSPAVYKCALLGGPWSPVSEERDVFRAEGRLETTGQRV